MKNKSFYFEIFFFYFLIIVVNFTFFRAYPGFLDIHPHPFWLGILLFGFRYGLVAGSLSGFVSTFSYLGLIWFFGERYVFEDVTFYILPALFIILGTLIGLGVNRYIFIIANQKKSMQDLGQEIINLSREVEAQKAISRDLEKKIVSRFTTMVTLYEGARRLDANDLDELTAGIVDFFAKALNLEAASLYMRTDTGWVLRARYGWENPNQFPAAYGANEGLVGLAGSSRRLVTIKDFTTTGNEGHGPRECLLACPLYNGENGDLVAIFAVQKIAITNLNSATTNLLSFLAAWASRSLGRSFYMEEMRGQEIMDNELNVYTYSYFETRLKQEFIRSVTYYLPVSLMLVRLTGLADKDIAVKHKYYVLVSRLLNESLRDTDVLAKSTDARLSFMCLLSTTTEAKASELAKIIEDRFNKLQLHDGVELHLGISSFMPGMNDAQMLIEKARTMLDA
ncbi:hypothetical protein K1X76_05965 [bacterium]|nr:hypothetical protein [bacterium]